MIHVWDCEFGPGTVDIQFPFVQCVRSFNFFLLFGRDFTKIINPKKLEPIFVPHGHDF